MTVAHAEAELAQIQANDIRLKAEINKLEVELAKNGEQFARLQDYLKLDQELNVKYGAVSPMEPKKVTEKLIDTASAVAEAPATRPRSRNSTVEIEAAAVEILRRHDGWMHTRDIIDVLLRQGVSINSPHRNNYVSNILSRSNRLMNNRASGWHLKEPLPKTSAPTEMKTAKSAGEIQAAEPTTPGEHVSAWREAAE